MGKDSLILVDGSSYLFRAFHALPALSTSQGQPTGAIHGVVAMLRRFMMDYQPAYMAVVFDAKGKTFRHEWYPEYKANRPPMPPELSRQIAPLYAIVRAMGLQLLLVDGVEADDVIGTLARRASDAHLDTVISTGDKDLAQLVDGHVRLINTMTDTVLDGAGVEKKFGVPPELMVDYLTLIGDPVDNIPGVPKVGPKTAAKWLEEYGSLEALVRHSDEIKGKIGDSLRASLGHLPLSKKLLTIACDVALECELPDLKPQPVDTEALKKLYTELEFKTWMGELLAPEAKRWDAGSSSVSSDTHYEMVLTRSDLDRWIRRLDQADLIAFDTETTSLDYMEAELVGVSFSVEPNTAAYVPFGHAYPGVPRQLSQDSVLGALRPLLADPERAKIGHNLKYDTSVLANHDIELSGIRYDSMLESYVLDSTATRHDLDSLALKYLGVRTMHFEDVAGTGAKQVTFDKVPLDAATHYAAEDADVSLKLHRALWPRLESEPGLRALFEQIEIPLIPVLSRIERHGVKVDASMLAEQSEELTAKMQAIEQRAYELAGQEFNLGSPRQIQTVLFDKLGLPARGKTPKGQPSTAESVLQELALDYPLPKLILEHRALSKLKSTYTDTLPKQINRRTGRVHTSYHQAVAATGRLSSSDPNLQNIPVRTEEGRRIRKAFVAEPGYKILAADYSQIELRIMAHLSADAGLLSAFASGEDIHRATAAEVLGIPPEQINHEQRRAAKAVNFGLIYGMSAFGLARQLGIERAAAQDYVDRYFTRYPEVRRFMDATRVKARQKGYVETVFGRRLYLPEINARNAQRRQYAERTAINAPMQGSAADIIKRAMLAVDTWIRDTGIDAKIIMQVHDELVFEVTDSAVADARGQIAQMMANAADLSVPLVADVGVGCNWDEAH